MLRAALLALIAAAPLAAQTPATKKPPATKAAPAKAPATPAKSPGTTKTASTKTGTTKTATRPPMKSSLSGVYTTEEAAAGKDLYVALCSSCHLTANLHTGPEFRKKWAGKTLSELYTYMRALMPKNDPGSLGDEDYSSIVAYILQNNKMPAGKAYLSTDTLELRKIRIDTVRAVRKP